MIGRDESPTCPCPSHTEEAWTGLFTDLQTKGYSIIPDIMQKNIKLWGVALGGGRAALGLAEDLSADSEQLHCASLVLSFQK